jgi:hypothetical protein
MYVERNIVAGWCNHCCSGQAINTTYSGCVFVALGIQRAMRMLHTVTCVLFVCIIFFHFISYTEKKKKKRY